MNYMAELNSSGDGWVIDESQPETATVSLSRDNYGNPVFVTNGD